MSEQHLPAWAAGLQQRLEAMRPKRRKPSARKAKKKEVDEQTDTVADVEMEKGEAPTE